MKFLTIEQGLFLHARLIEETGETHGMRVLPLLESAVAALGQPSAAGTSTPISSPKRLP